MTTQEEHEHQENKLLRELGQAYSDRNPIKNKNGTMFIENAEGCRFEVHDCGLRFLASDLFIVATMMIAAIWSAARVGGGVYSLWLDAICWIFCPLGVIVWISKIRLKRSLGNTLKMAKRWYPVRTAILKLFREYRDTIFSSNPEILRVLTYGVSIESIDGFITGVLDPIVESIVREKVRYQVRTDRKNHRGLDREKDQVRLIYREFNISRNWSSLFDIEMAKYGAKK